MTIVADDAPSSTASNGIVWILGAAIVSLVIAVLVVPSLSGDDPADDTSADIEPATPTTTVPNSRTDNTIEPGATRVAPTEFGDWTWTKIDPPVQGEVVYLDRRVWLADPATSFDFNGEMRTDETRRSELLVSPHGLEWDRLPLPDEMQDLVLSVSEFDGDLAIRGWRTGSPTAQLWTTPDAVTWTVQPPAGTNGEELPTGFESDGVSIEVGTPLFEPAVVGDTMVMVGWLTVRHPDTVHDRVGSIQYWDHVLVEADQTTAVARSEFSTPLATLTIEQDGAVLTFTYRDGPNEDGDVLHRGTLRAPDEVVASYIRTESGFPPSVPVAWRSDDGGDTWTIVDDPLAEFQTADTGGYLSTYRVVGREGRFIAYGVAPGTEPVRVNEFVTRNEIGVVGAIATSTDGATWTAERLHDIDAPGGVTLVGDTVLWAGTNGLWVSDDGTTFEQVDVPRQDAHLSGSFGDLAILVSSSSMHLSLDGRRWETVPFPETTAAGQWARASGDAVVFTTFGPSGPKATWLGMFEPPASD